jgi:DNA-binding transcriptional ArsR family regulator
MKVRGRQLRNYILNAILDLESKGENVTFTKLYRRLKISSRTLSRHLANLEKEGVISRKRVGELKIITITRIFNQEDDKTIACPELYVKIFKNSLFESIYDVFDFLKFLTYYNPKKRLTQTEFSDLSYAEFFNKYKSDILSLLFRLADLEPLSEKQRAIWFTIYWFLKENIKTLPLSVLVFFPLYQIPKSELHKIPPKLRLLITNLPKALYPLIQQEGYIILDYYEKTE